MQIRTATNADLPEIQELVRSVLAEFDLPLNFSGSDADLLDLEATYTNNGGVFMVAVDAQGRIIGTVAMCKHQPGTAMLRKMYVFPSGRGQGLGRRLLGEALEWARQAGYETVILETVHTMHAAMALYESAGFRRIESPTVSTRCDRVYRLDL